MEIEPGEGLVVSRVRLYERVPGATLMALQVEGTDFVSGEPATGKVLIFGPAEAQEVVDYLHEIISASST